MAKKAQDRPVGRIVGRFQENGHDCLAVMVPEKMKVSGEDGIREIDTDVNYTARVPMDAVWQAMDDATRVAVLKAHIRAQVRKPEEVPVPLTDETMEL